MTTSEVKSVLDDLSNQIKSFQATKLSLKQQLDSLRANLDGIPTAYADLVAAIQAYTPTGAHETLAKDELAKLTSEFQALKSNVQTAHNAL